MNRRTPAYKVMRACRRRRPGHASVIGMEDSHWLVCFLTTGTPFDSEPVKESPIIPKVLSSDEPTAIISS